MGGNPNANWRLPNLSRPGGPQTSQFGRGHSEFLSGRRLRLQIMTVRPEFVVALFQAFGGGEFLQLLQMFEQVLLQCLRGCRGAVVTAPGRLGADLTTRPSSWRS